LQFTVFASFYRFVAAATSIYLFMRVRQRFADVKSASLGVKNGLPAFYLTRLQQVQTKAKKGAGIGLRVWLLCVVSMLFENSKVVVTCTG